MVELQRWLSHYSEKPSEHWTFGRGESKGGRWFSTKSCLLLAYIVGKKGQVGNEGNIVWIL